MLRVEMRSLVPSDRAKALLVDLLRGGPKPAPDRSADGSKPAAEPASAPPAPPLVVPVPAAAPATKPQLSPQAQQRLDEMLFTAIGKQDHTIMREALASGANPNAIDHEKVTPMGRQAHVFVFDNKARRRMETGAQILLDAGASPNCLTEFGNSVIGEWISKGFDPAFFQRYSMNYDMRDKDGNNAFTDLYRGFMNDAQKRDHDSYKPAPSGHFVFSTLLSRLQQLKDLGCDLNGRNKKGHTALHTLSLDEHKEWEPDRFSSVSLRVDAILKQVRELVGLFVESYFAIGGSPDIQDLEGMTALMQALKRYDWLVVDAIMRNQNMDLSLRNKNGQSLLMTAIHKEQNFDHRYASSDSHDKLIEFIAELRRRGAPM